MTHFAVLVLVQDRTNIELEISRLLAPYDENGEWGADGTRWDWYEIGGRFTGLLDGYDPGMDPRNYEPCGYCKDGITDQATADKFPAYEHNVGKPCRQCNLRPDGSPHVRPEGVPLGYRRTWFNAPHLAGDILPLSQVDVGKMEWVPSSLVTPDGEWHERTRFGWWGSELPDEEGNEPKTKEEWRPEFEALIAKYPDAIAVVVDCHV